MSGWKKAPSIDDDCECVNVSSVSDVDISVIRSADGKTCKITIPLSSALNALKDAINSDRALGPIKREHQRLFHLGRELKSGSRSLSAMGIGKYGVFTIHLHSSAPKTVNLQESDDENNASGKRAARRKEKKKNNNAAAGVDHNDVIDLLGSGSDPSGGARAENANNRRTQQPRHQEEKREKVVELLDSDSDEDEEVVEIIDTPTKRRRRK
mmetsp:Transcript_24978/g.60127  ORF Transcript_24978/g.60127 Transcript_24978/m.60127 type:complete len:211 (-) Transcript_24978:207-839(-)|eukprot:CAMPEP_0181120428 /NCGR_PEP_ID=MMETSP1071-20121207/24154_1 /TAXON_ID=35127 /ORGANISM="Thalassiosira sp., Strain NH16" /LENGTH=210 /DNA_ID=CAMNT_0023205089 /DNA_START=109 /DNA_END=741 /DNA_ORIENTATION=+